VVRHTEFAAFIARYSTADARVQTNKTRQPFKSFTEVLQITHLKSTTQNESMARLVNGRTTAWRDAGGSAMRR
jgi:hypothetical protein